MIHYATVLRSLLLIISLTTFLTVCKVTGFPVCNLLQESPVSSADHWRKDHSWCVEMLTFQASLDQCSRDDQGDNQVHLRCKHYLLQHIIRFMFFVIILHLYLHLGPFCVRLVTQNPQLDEQPLMKCLTNDHVVAVFSVSFAYISCRGAHRLSKIGCTWGVWREPESSPDLKMTKHDF